MDEETTVEHLDALYAYALRLSQSATDAEDLVQETMARFLARAGPTPQPVRPYLFRILRNLYVDGWRRRSPCPLPLAPAPSAEDIVLREMLSAWLEEALAELEPALREVLWLREVEGFSYAEISEVMDCPTNTVRSRLSRARSQVLLRLGREGERVQS